MNIHYSPGSIVACRDRTWVVLPSDLLDIIRLRPLAGNESEICGIYTLLENNITSAQFPPEAEAIQDHAAGKLLLEAARLSLRSGAGPFRCLGRLSVSPRPYQLVPLLMALKLETVRMLIADDVGIGKTVEAGLIAREMLDRSEIRRLAILCPPQLCDQWQQELKQKFHIDAVVIRSGTVSKLERELPSGDSHVFSYYPHIIVSLDYAKSDRRRASFLTHCPDLVIVDEAHTASNKNAEALKGSKQDSKLQQLIGLVKDLLAEGYNPIIWCRYIATANYVADALKTKLERKKNSQVRVIPISGEQSEDEREIRLSELKEYPQRVMVATDCLSEGVNLQEHFTAVVHYDLPWNPNRLEQREGRIERYGQTATNVKCILLYGQDNPVDGAVLDVLIRKAVKIHRALGITVPVPMDSSTVQEAVFKSLFEKVEAKQLSLLPPEAEQLTLDLVLQEAPVVEVNQSWDRAVEREKQNRTRFAQRAIKPEEVKRELEESDRILGNQETVEHFVRNACERLNTPLTKKKQGRYLSTVPQCLRSTLGDKPRLITFTSPAPEGMEYTGRNHPIVEGLARYLLEEAISNSKEPTAARCGVTVTNAVSKPTAILLLRLRHLLESPKHSDLLVEECLVKGFIGAPSQPQWLSQEETLELMAKVEPTDDLPFARKQLSMERLLSSLSDLEVDLNQFALSRAEALRDSHRRVRAITKEGQVKVKPQLPMDILGVYYLLPE